MGEIGSGDMVMVVKPSPCCGWSADVGRIETAVSCHMGPAMCINCRTWRVGRVWSTVGDQDCGYLEECLKKIKPLDEGDKDETAEVDLARIIAAVANIGLV